MRDLVGGPGNDGVLGGRGSDNLPGSSGNDLVAGDGGSDSAVGEQGRDLVDGGSGSDRMLGEGGGDQIVDGPIGEAAKDDVFSSGDGDDMLIADHVPAVRAIVSCGAVFDRGVADSKDVVADDCERVRLVHGSKAEVLDQEDAFFNSLPPAQREFFDTFFDNQLAPFPNA